MITLLIDAEIGEPDGRITVTEIVTCPAEAVGKMNRAVRLLEVPQLSPVDSRTQDHEYVTVSDVPVTAAVKL